MQARLPATVANLVKPTRYIPVLETAKLIRRALKEAFPEIRFSVRTSQYAGGSSINISWAEGPKHDTVKDIAEAFQGGDFDGMTDCKKTRSHTINGEPVKFGGDFVFCTREIPKEKISAAADIFARMDVAKWAGFMIRFGVDATTADGIINHNTTARECARAFLHEIEERKFSFRRSALADSITNLSTD